MSGYYLKSITKRRLEFGTSGCTCKSGVIPRFIEALRLYLWLLILLCLLKENKIKLKTKIYKFEKGNISHLQNKYT